MAFKYRVRRLYYNYKLCIRCNNHKAGRTPEDADMQLLAIPFIPTHAEYIYLQGHNVLADQMEFLRAHFPRSSPLHQRLGRTQPAYPQV